MAEGNQLGSLLVDRQLLTAEQLAEALEEQTRTRQSLGRVLIDHQLVTESDLVATLATQIGLDFVDLSEFSIDPSAAGLITDALARRYQALPVAWEDGRLVVAMADPSNVFAIDDIRTVTATEVKAVVATRASILEAIDRHHSMDGDVENISAEAS